MDKSYDEVVKRIVEYRKSKRLSQAEMAERLGLTQSHYSKIEKGVKSITNDVLIKMHRMGMNMDYIVTGIEAMDSRIDGLVEKCSTDRMLNFMNIILLYINMILKSKKSEGLNCKNEFQILEYNIHKKNGQDVGTVWSSIRKAQRLTQAEMADILDINIKSYRKIEKGISMPTAEILTNLYKNLGYYPTLIQDVDTNYSLMINGVWNKLSPDDKKKLEDIVGYSLKFINEKLS